MLPSLRTKLKNVSKRNKALQDILASCKIAESVISVEEHKQGIHNTKIILQLSNGEKRVHFYNRVLLSTAIPEGFLSSGNISLDIENLNGLYGCDFTDDDLELVSSALVAKATSLGYYDKVEVPETELLSDATTLLLYDRSNYAQFNSTCQLEIKVTDADNVVQYWRSNPILSKDGPMNLTEWYQVLIANFEVFEKSDLGKNFSLTKIPKTFMVDQYMSENGFIIKIRNETSKILEIAVLLRSYQKIIDGGTTYIPEQLEPLLLNTRLQPKGTKASGTYTDDIMNISLADLENPDKGLWDPDNNFGNGNYVGEYISINGGTKNSIIPFEVDGNPIPTEYNSLSPYIDDRDFGLGKSVRYFISSHLLNDGYFSGPKHPNTIPNQTMMLLKNVADTPITIQYAGFNKPIVLAPDKNVVRQDQVLIGGTDLLPRSVIGEAMVFRITYLDTNEVFEVISDDGNSFLYTTAQELATKLAGIVDFAILTERYSDVDYFYSRNLTNRDMRIQFGQNFVDRSYIIDTALKAKGSAELKVNDLPELDLRLLPPPPAEVIIESRGVEVIEPVNIGLQNKGKYDNTNPEPEYWNTMYNYGIFPVILTLKTGNNSKDYVCGTTPIPPNIYRPQ